MKIGLIGFGKTGRSVASAILQNSGFCLEWILKQKKSLEDRSASEFLGVDSDDPGCIYSTQSVTMDELLDKHPVDVIIDFSSSKGLHTYGEAAASRGIKIISAISHYEETDQLYLKTLSESTTVFWSPNITLGVNYLLFVSKLLKKIAPWVDVEIVEEHFKGKDGISGTAIRIAEALDVEEKDINSVRAGGIVGKHEVIFGFPYQTVRLIHESIAREAFGNGVLFVAENLKDKPSGLYTFEDILIPYFDVHELN
ncbi:MAG: dihydrodipicolinate reductase [Candidatus Fluviicola riflensis]|nr:MAG: dihydrodipicolinate reductase [Candidatus Fluviicola riflensis]OGS78772.1 MAG: dihydrodipicolinate reductase [Candidatus Fluviicola riflensis]OGS86203.1 MAG: dihydrodipicolinate reductase [Fluviicola sp. RIFCSPHIGHO2_01_FULL_43_53]OGS87734.1 MAG: dihydrodipicolinate reductase [Fluviicola sp. RIFCSPHIGHO2_12_FULL_43_24]